MGRSAKATAKTGLSEIPRRQSSRAKQVVVGRVLGRYPCIPRRQPDHWRCIPGNVGLPRGPRELLADEPSYPPRKVLSARTLTAGAAVRRLDFMEAAYALCPQEAELYREGGAALKAAMLGDADPNDPWTEFLAYPLLSRRRMALGVPALRPLRAAGPAADRATISQKAPQMQSASGCRFTYFLLAACERRTTRTSSMKFRLSLIYLSLRRGESPHLV